MSFAIYSRAQDIHLSQIMFLTAILHRGFRNSFFYAHILFPCSIWTLISPYVLKFYFPFLFWTSLCLFYLDFNFPLIFRLLFPFSIFLLFLFFQFFFQLLAGPIQLRIHGSFSKNNVMILDATKCQRKKF